MKAVRRGDVFHRFFKTTTPPKNKFFVIVGEDKNNYVGYFFINSNINNYVIRNEEMNNMQMPIKPEDYPFLTHLSFIGGHELSTLPKKVLITELSNGTTQLKGRMRKEDLDMLLEAAKTSTLFSAKEKAFFQ